VPSMLPVSSKIYSMVACMRRYHRSESAIPGHNRVQHATSWIRDQHTLARVPGPPAGSKYGHCPFDSNLRSSTQWSPSRDCRESESCTLPAAVTVRVTVDSELEPVGLSRRMVLALESPRLRVCQAAGCGAGPCAESCCVKS
jgi:hypothetical protein